MHAAMKTISIFFVTVDTSKQIHDSHDMVITLDSAINRKQFRMGRNWENGLDGSEYTEQARENAPRRAS